jgi:fructose-1,6-bisphosphatase/inositol monophosphatase family enzyme
MRARRTRLAMTYNPITDEMFYAREGHGAYLNGRRLPLRQVTADIGRAVGGVDFKRIPKLLADRIAVSPPFYSQRNFGSSTLDWCNLAAGRLDLYLHGGQMLWDYAAGSLILREAGGQMCTLRARRLRCRRGMAAAGHRRAAPGSLRKPGATGCVNPIPEDRHRPGGAQEQCMIRGREACREQRQPVLV